MSRRKIDREERARMVALEKQLVKEGKIFPRDRYVPHSFFGRILAVLLAFLIGVFAAIGGILGAGFYVGTRPLKDAFALFNLDYSEFLTDTAADMTILELTGKLSEGGLNSLDAIARYTPYVDTLLQAVSDQLEPLGVNVDTQALKTTPFNEIGDFLSATVQDVEIGKVIGVNASSDPLMLALCYGTEGTNEEGGDYTVNENGEIVMNEGKSPTTIQKLTSSASDIVGTLTVESALGVTAESNSAMRFLAYGTQGIQYELRGEGGALSVEMLRDPLTGKAYAKKTLGDLMDSPDVLGSARIGDMVTISPDASGLLHAIRDWTVGDLGKPARIERLRLSQVFDTGNSTSNIMKAIGGWRISDLKDQNKIDSLVLGDILTIDETSAPVLAALADSPIGELSHAADTLRLTDILGEEAVMGNKLLKNLAQSTTSTLSADIEALTFAQVYGSELYSYLDLGTDAAGKAYADYLMEYDPLDETSARPEPVDPDLWTITEKRVLAEDPLLTARETQTGWFRTENGAHIPVADSDIRRDAEGAFAEIRVSLSPDETVWRTVDFDNGGALADLPAGVSVGTAGAGYEIVEDTSGTPVLSETGRPLYYLASVEVPLPAEPEAGEGSGETDEEAPPAGGAETLSSEVRTYYFAYPVLEDEGGCYARTYRVNETTQETTFTRVDLERSVLSYTDGTRSYPLSDDGTITYDGAVYPVYTRTQDGEESAYFTLRAEAQELEYYLDNGVCRFVTGDEVTTVYTGVQTAGGETHYFDRYLSGTWYLLFGGEVIHRGEDGSATAVTVTDNTDTPVLDIAPEVSKVTSTINDKMLWELWLHGVIGTDPYAELPVPYQPDGAEAAYTNLNQLTVTQIIGYIKFLPEAIGRG